MKTRPLEYHTCTPGNKPAHRTGALWAFLYRFVGHVLELRESVAAGGALVFVRWHDGFLRIWFATPEFFESPGVLLCYFDSFLVSASSSEMRF